MNLFLPTGLGLIVVALIASTWWLARRAEVRFPPAGRIVQLGGRPVHFIDIAAGERSDLAPMVFIHGAGGNARDLAGAFAGQLAGRGRMIFVDRPGAGYSGRRGRADASPQVQAGTLAGLLDALEIDRAVIIGHSFGGAVAAAFAVHHPDRTAGLVLVAPATHPWPGNALTWYYNIANLPVLGRAFAHLIAVPFGNLLYRSAVRSVFDPDKPPRDYGERSGTRLVLRPGNFFHNAVDVGALNANLKRLAPRYREIIAPTVVISGDSDNVVAAELHSQGLARDIAGAELVWLDNTGHMPTYSATSVIIAQIEKLNARIGSRGNESRRVAAGQ